MLRPLALALILSGVAAGAQAQNLQIHGGPIYTGVEAAPRAELVQVRDGRIVFTGRAAEAPDATGLTDIDLAGATLFPGFTDGHAHLDGIGAREMELNLEGSASVDEAMARLKAWAEAHPEGPILGRGWIETRWPEARFLTRQDLDAAAPGRLVALWRADGHATVISSSVLAAAGINASTVAPSGGEILKDSAGQPTGLLVDAAMGLLGGFWSQIGDNPVSARDRYRAGFAVYARYGWTGIHFMSAPWDDVPLLEEMAEAGEAPIRVYNSISPEGAAALIASGPRSVADGRVITRAIKYYADGALGSRGAALFDPYADSPVRPV